MVICTPFIEPLNLECIFINTFSESLPIFLGVFILFISYLAARFKMNGYSFFAMLALFSLIMIRWEEGLFVLITLIGGIMIYYVLSKINQ